MTRFDMGRVSCIVALLVVFVRVTEFGLLVKSVRASRRSTLLRILIFPHIRLVLTALGLVAIGNLFLGRGWPASGFFAGFLVVIGFRLLLSGFHYPIPPLYECIDEDPLYPTVRANPTLRGPL